MGRVDTPACRDRPPSWDPSVSFWRSAPVLRASIAVDEARASVGEILLLYRRLSMRSTRCSSGRKARLPPRPPRLRSRTDRRRRRPPPRLRRGRPLRRSPPLPPSRPLSLRSPRRRRRRTKRPLRKRKSDAGAEHCARRPRPSQRRQPRCLRRRSRRDRSRCRPRRRSPRRRPSVHGRLRRRLGRAGPFGSADLPWRSAQSCSFAIRSNRASWARLPRRARPRPGPRAGRAGEILRRNERAGEAATLFGGRVEAAYIPGVLTAAGTVAAFGSVYAAYALYGFIGRPSPSRRLAQRASPACSPPRCMGPRWPD